MIQFGCLDVSKRLYNKLARIVQKSPIVRGLEIYDILFAFIDDK